MKERTPVFDLVYKKTDLGFNVVVDSQFIGLVYHNSIFSPIEIGQSIKCYVDKIRTDGKIDLKLRKGGLENIDDDALKFLEYLKLRPSPVGSTSGQTLYLSFISFDFV